MNGGGSILLNAGSTLTVNQTTGDGVGLSLDGSGTLVKTGGGNLNYIGAGSMTGEIIVERSLFQISNVGRLLSVSQVTLNGGSLLLDNNGVTRTNNRLGNSMPITLNSADGGWSGTEGRPRGLSIRTNQNAATNEDFGALNIASGANYAYMEARNGNTAREVQLITDNIARTAGSTLNVRANHMGVVNTAQSTQLRINNSTNQTAFIGTMVGGGGAAGTVTRSIVPWAIGEELVNAALVDTHMGNTFLTYVSGRGFEPLDLSTDYGAFGGGATDNVRVASTTDTTGIVGQTLNSLVLHNDNTAASTVNVTGTGASQTLTNTSGGFLFTLNTGADADSLHTTTLGGFDDGIAVGGSEYLFFVNDPSAAGNTAQLTAQIDSPLITAADIVKSGRGTLALTQVNTAGGGSNRTVINEGAIQITDLDQIGGDTGTVLLAGGNLQIGTGFADDLGTRTYEVNVVGGGIDTNGENVSATSLAVSGGGDFTKTGLGTLTIAGTPTLTQGGEFIVQRGVVEMNSTTPNAFGSGNIAIRPITMGGSTVTLRNLANDQIDDNATVRFFNVGGSGSNPSGSRWELGAFSETVGGIEMTSVSGSSTRITVDAGGVLTVNGDIILNNNRGGTGTTAEMVEITGNGALDLGGAARRIEVNSTATADGTDAGIETIIQNGGIIKEGEHILYLENAGNTYAGGTVINEGTVSIADANHLGADTGGNGLELRNGGTLQSTGASVTLGANRTVLLDGSGGQIEVTGAATNTLQIDSIISGHDCGPLTKLGEGVLAVTQANTYEGGTVVSAGTLFVNNTTGSGTGTGSVTVQNSAILGGSGIVSGAVTVETGGTIAAGNSIDMLTVGSLDLNAGSTALFEIGGATTNDSVGLMSYQENPGGFVVPASWINYQDGVTNHDHILISGTEPVINGTVELTLDSYTPVFGDVFHLLDWTGLGTSSATGSPSFTLPTLTGIDWSTDFFASHGVIVVVPEPARFSLICLAGLAMFLRRRRV